MIPSVYFRYSYVYERNLHAPHIEANFDQVEYINFTSNYIKNIEKKWVLVNNEILRFISNITGLKWKRKTITCYVIKISPSAPFSDPLTISIQLKKGKEVITRTDYRFIDILVHELIHNIFIDNKVDYLNHFKKKYKNEAQITLIHIPVHAIHKEIYLKFFNKKRLEIEKKLIKNYEYKRSWEIVEKEGSANIIKELKSFIKNTKTFGKD